MEAGNLNKLKTVQQNMLAIPQDKRDISRIGAGIIASILNGEINALEADIKLRRLETIIDQVRKNQNVREEVFKEADKYPQKTFTEYNAEISKTHFARYDYSACGDSEHTELVKQIQDINERRKEREKFLQSLKDNVVSEETGEIISPPVKQSADTVRVKLL